jgi:hypothetical protein
MGKVPIEKKKRIGMSILDAIFGHTRKNKGLKWTSLFGLKIC